MAQTTGTRNLPTDDKGESHVGWLDASGNYQAPPGDTAGLWTQIRRPAGGSKTFFGGTTGISVPNNTATQIVPAEASRVSVSFWQRVTETQVVFYLGRDNTVTTTTGVAVAAPLSVVDTDSRDAWWVVQNSGGPVTVDGVKVLAS